MTWASIHEIFLATRPRNHPSSAGCPPRRSTFPTPMVMRWNLSQCSTSGPILTSLALFRPGSNEPSSARADGPAMLSLRLSQGAECFTSGRRTPERNRASGASIRLAHCHLDEELRIAVAMASDTAIRASASSPRNSWSVISSSSTELTRLHTTDHPNCRVTSSASCQRARSPLARRRSWC